MSQELHNGEGKNEATSGLSYVRDMLWQLRTIVAAERHPFLLHLVEMACMQADAETGHTTDGKTRLTH